VPTPKGISGYVRTSAPLELQERPLLTPLHLHESSPTCTRNARPPPFNSHLIRRFDTDAVSASSLFRVAYPHASEQSEYVKSAAPCSSIPSANAGRCVDCSSTRTQPLLFRSDEMAYLSKRYNTKAAGDEDETGSGKLTGTW